MFVDGLWLSGVTIEINRLGVPIPEDAQQTPIRVELSPVQINAVAALLGFGMRGGDFLMYQDADLSRMLLNKHDVTIRTDYASLSSGLKDNRRTVNVFTPLVEREDLSDYEGFIGEDDEYGEESEGIIEEDEVNDDDSFLDEVAEDMSDITPASSVDLSEYKDIMYDEFEEESAVIESFDNGVVDSGLDDDNKINEGIDDSNRDVEAAPSFFKSLYDERQCSKDRS